MQKNDSDSQYLGNDKTIPHITQTFEKKIEILYIYMLSLKFNLEKSGNSSEFVLLAAVNETTALGKTLFCIKTPIPLKFPCCYGSFYPQIIFIMCNREFNKRCPLKINLNDTLSIIQHKVIHPCKTMLKAWSMFKQSYRLFKNL